MKHAPEMFPTVLLGIWIAAVGVAALWVLYELWRVAAERTRTWLNRHQPVQRMSNGFTGICQRISEATQQAGNTARRGLTRTTRSIPQRRWILSGSLVILIWFSWPTARDTATEAATCMLMTQDQRNRATRAVFRSRRQPPLIAINMLAYAIGGAYRGEDWRTGASVGVTAANVLSVEPACKAWRNQ